MIHEQIIQFRAGATHEYRAGINEGIQFHGEGCRRAGRAIWYIQKSSLSVCAQSPGRGQRGSSSRPKNSLYHQIVAGLDSKTSAIRRFHRQESERNSDPGSGGLSPWNSWAWLRAGNLPPEESIWNTVLTVCRKGRSSKLISFLYLPGVGRRVVALTTARNQQGV